ncbi:cytochrome P450 3A29-like [Haliotis cracherodii]|uniref:cytochrome P450 3A29-like n=1 Tax=Haliotis cracherodii TaxID=6455 RepID=UPI0039EB1CD6
MEILGLFDVPLNLILALTAIVLIYIYGTWNFNYFKEQGIPGPAPYPFIGNSAGFGIFYDLPTLRQRYGRTFGIFTGRRPCFVISDLDILKEVLVKSFNNFRNRAFPMVIPYPFSLALAFLEDASWKRVRSILSPTFSGGKLRRMCIPINDCDRALANNFSKAIGKDEGVPMKQYFGAYTMDVISRTAFGIKVDSQNDFNHPFVVNAKQMFSPTKLRSFFALLGVMIPVLAPFRQKLGMGFFPQTVIKFFHRNIREMIKQRQHDSKEQREQRNDFLQHMIDAEGQDQQEEKGGVANGGTTDNHSVKRLSADEIVAQGILFFIAGYETTASTLQFVSYCLATHPDIQKKAYNEIKEKLGNEYPDYDNIGKLKYLDSVITETLRLYPAAVMLNRNVSETIKIRDITISVGQTVFIPVMAMQRDAQLYKDPDSFKPERHDEKSNPLSFLAFGYGPRACIGMRLALVEAKIALVHVMKIVTFERAPDTPDVLTFKRNSLLLQPSKDIILKVSPRC